MLKRVVVCVLVPAVVALVLLAVPGCKKSDSKVEHHHQVDVQKVESQSIVVE